MRRVLRLVLPIAAIVAATAAAAQAASFTDTFDPLSTQYFSGTGAACTSSNGAGSGASDTIGGGGGADGCVSLAILLVLDGYSNPPDTLTDASLELTFLDDSDPSGNPNGNKEQVVISLDSILQGGALDYDASGPVVFANVKLFVAPDGKINVSLVVGPQAEGQADFLFDSAVLNGIWDENGDAGGSGSAPEPATMLLLGSGLAAAGYRRFRSRPQVH